MGAVGRAASEAAATQACAFWFDVERRHGYWAGGNADEEIGRAGSPGQGLTPLSDKGQADRVRLWAGATAEGPAAAVLTRERLACLASRWREGDAAALRREIGKVLTACLTAVPRQRRPQRTRRQDAWQPGAAEEDDVGTAEEEAAEAAREAEAAEEAALAATPVDGAAVWLARVSEPERAAVQNEGTADEQRLAASAHVFGVEPGAELTMSGVKALWQRLTKRLHPDKAGEAAKAAFQVLHAAKGFLDQYLRHQHGVRAPGRLPAARGDPPRPTPPPAAPSSPGAPPPTEARPKTKPKRPMQLEPEAVAQVPTAIRAWIRRNMLGEKAGEALTSPLTSPLATTRS